MTKKRAFDAEEIAEEAPSEAPPAPERTQLPPHARTSIAIVVASWLLPLGMLASILGYSEGDDATRLVHRGISIGCLALLLLGLGFAIRAIDAARKDGRIRRRLAYAALLLGLFTPVVWASELAFAYELYLAREELDSAEAGADGSSTPAE
jgi:hypothetical protein